MNAEYSDYNIHIKIYIVKKEVCINTQIYKPIINLKFLRQIKAKRSLHKYTNLQAYYKPKFLR